jgi:intracellular multiplication protein IcmT
MQSVQKGVMVVDMKINAEAHWRDSARSIKFFIWDGKAAFPMLLFFFHIALWTFITAVVAMVFFTVLNRFGFSPIVFLRWLRSSIAGPRKLAIPWWMR